MKEGPFNWLKEMTFLGAHYVAENERKADFGMTEKELERSNKTHVFYLSTSWIPLWTAEFWTGWYDVCEIYTTWQ